MKRVFLLLFSLFFLNSVLCAEKFGAGIGFTLGKSSFKDVNNSQLENIGFTEGSYNIALGGEIRIAVGKNLRTDVVGEFAVLDSDFESRKVSNTLGKKFIFFNGMADLAFNFDIKIGKFKKMNVGIGLGPYAFCVLYDKSLNDIFPEEYWNDKKNFLSTLVAGNFNYRLTYDVYVADVMSVGLAYTLPTNFNLSNFTLKYLIPFQSDVGEAGKLSFCVQMRVL